jgi:hypothetical protein
VLETIHSEIGAVNAGYIIPPIDHIATGLGLPPGVLFGGLKTCSLTGDYINCDITWLDGILFDGTPPHTYRTPPEDNITTSLSSVGGEFFGGLIDYHDPFDSIATDLTHLAGTLE